jgi:phage baseplate assembly protein W
MAVTYGIDFPFRDSSEGKFLQMTSSPEKEIRADLIHLLLTKKGSRYFLPDFGTRLYQYIFEPNDANTFALIEGEIRDAVSKYIPNLTITTIEVISAEDDPNQAYSIAENEDNRLFRVSDMSNKPYTAVVKISYTVNAGAFSTSDFIILNI